MAITLDTIVNKVFKVVKNGYDNNEVEAFLDEILEEMENREAETGKRKEKIAAPPVRQLPRLPRCRLRRSAAPRALSSCSRRRRALMMRSSRRPTPARRKS